MNYNRNRQRFELQDGSVVADMRDTMEFLVCRELFQGLHLSDVWSAVRDYMQAEESDLIELYISDEAAEYWQGDDAVPGPVLLYLDTEESPRVTVSASVHAGPDVWDEWPEMETFLAHWSQMWPVRVRALEQDEYSVPSINIWHSEFDWLEDDSSLADILRFGYSLHGVVEAYTNSTFHPDMVLALLRANNVPALVGLRESNNLEAKRTLRLATDHDVHEAAKDVAAMANADNGGVVVIGLSTKRSAGSDVIDKVTPVRDGIALKRRLTRIIDDYVYPRVDGLIIEAVKLSADDDWVIALFVPAQEVGTRPFLVTGTTIDGKLNKAYVSIPLRSGEDTTYMGPAAIHSAIVVGRAVLTGRLGPGPQMPPASPGSL